MEKVSSQPCVLVIDDDHDVCAVITCTLEAVLGWTVITAHSGVAGIALAEQHQPNLILLDVAMPGLNGRETFAHLKRTPHTAHIPVVFITASGDEKINELSVLGPRAVVAKPFDPVELANNLSQLIAANA
jgi:CheY-like chemotaxis protein